MTSTVNTAAATGASSTADSAAAMPHMMQVSWSPSSRSPSRGPSHDETLPPNCSAAASLPTDPPHRSVQHVPRKMAGASARGTGREARAASMTSEVPSENGRRSARYSP